MAHPGREIEFKFAVQDRQAFDRLVAHLNLPASFLAEGITQVNHFFDSTKLCLHKNHFAIRLREQKHENFLTIKGRHQREKKENILLTDRVEKEVAIARQDAEDLLHGRKSPQQLIFDHFKNESASILDNIQTACNDDKLLYIGKFSNVRIHLPPVTLQAGKTTETLEFELDACTFPGGSVEYEIEIEISAHSDAQRIEEALIELFQQAGIEWQAAPSKAERFFATLANSQDPLT